MGQGVADEAVVVMKRSAEDDIGDDVRGENRTKESDENLIKAKGGTCYKERELRVTIVKRPAGAGMEREPNLSVRRGQRKDDTKGVK